MCNDIGLFSFVPSSGRHNIPKWLGTGRLLATISSAELNAIFGPLAHGTVDEIIDRHRPALEAAARHRVEQLDHFSSGPIVVTRADFEI